MSTELTQQAAAVTVAVFAVCLLAAAAIWLMKRLGAGRPLHRMDGADDLRFIRAMPVGPRERLVVMAWGDETLLLGVTSSCVTLLTTRPQQLAAKQSLEDQQQSLHPAGEGC